MFSIRAAAAGSGLREIRGETARFFAVRRFTRRLASG